MSDGSTNSKKMKLRVLIFLNIVFILMASACNPHKKIEEPKVMFAPEVLRGELPDEFDGSVTQFVHRGSINLVSHYARFDLAKPLDKLLNAGLKLDDSIWVQAASYHSTNIVHLLLDRKVRFGGGSILLLLTVSEFSSAVSEVVDAYGQDITSGEVSSVISLAIAGRNDGLAEYLLSRFSLSPTDAGRVLWDAALYCDVDVAARLLDKLPDLNYQDEATGWNIATLLKIRPCPAVEKILSVK